MSRPAARLLAIALWLNVSCVVAEATFDDLYENVIPADTSECLDKVAALPLATYEMKYDSVKGRRHLGPVGPGLQEAIPESVEIHARSTYPAKKGEPPIVLENQAVVDKGVIFMNNVAATQELARRNELMWAQLQEQMEFDARMHEAIAEMQEKLGQEADEQLMERKRIADAEAEGVRLAAELEHLKAEEARDLLQTEAEQQQEASQKQLALAKRKLVAEAESNRVEKERMLRMQEESAERREALRLETEVELRRQRMDLEREMDAGKLKMDKERVRAEVEAKVVAEQENEDVLLRKIRAQGEEDRRRTQEAINTVLAHLASAAVGLMSDPRRAAILTSWLMGLVAGYLILKEATLLLRRLVETYLGKPGLVRETSRVGMLASSMHVLRCSVALVANIFGVKGGDKSTKGGWLERGLSGRARAVRAFLDVVLSPDLKEQVISLSVAMTNSKRNGAPYRHLLLYGPPGTGKTMVAKRLAASSGMDCAVMSGGDVGPLGKDAVTELHGLFKWAAKSPRGLLLFIDEAEAFLGKRSSASMSEDTRNALNALLYNTGSASHRLMMVLATNRAEDLDEAVLDRMDDSLLFPIPDRKARGQLLVQLTLLDDFVQHVNTARDSLKYFTKYCTAEASNGKGSVHSGKGRGILRHLSSWWRRAPSEGLMLGAGVDEALVRGLADEVQGFSGREVSKLMLAVQSCAYGSEDGVLTADMLKKVVSQKAREHETKAEMRASCA